MPSKNQWGDQEIVQDAAMNQKAIAQFYNISAGESITPNLRDDFLDILKDEQEILYELCLEMQKRGWYPVKMADQAQITSTLQKYQPQNP